MNIKKICITICFLILTGCGGSILDETALESESIQIQGISVTSGSTTASILWTTNAASTRQIIYGVTSGSYTDSTALSTVESTTHQVDLSGLATDQVYYYKIICSANGYETFQSAEYSFTTSSSITVSSLAAGNITTNSADITWTTNVATSHIVEYGTTAGVYTQSTVQSSTPSTSHTVSLTGLTSGTEYFYRIKNFHSTLPFISSTELSFDTVGVITVSSIIESSDTTSISVSWNTSLPTTGSINYGTSTGSTASVATESGGPSTIHSITITGLVKGTIYFYVINNTHATLGTINSSERNTSTTPTLVQKLRGIWMVGGLSGSGATALLAHGTVVSALDLFDPITNTWYADVASAATGDTYIPRSFAGIESFKISSADHRIYVIGGFDASGNTRNTVQYYSIENNTWTTDSVNPLPQYRANINAVRMQNKIYVMGGTGSAVATTVATGWAGTATNYEYTPTLGAGAWTAKAALAANVSERLSLAFNDVIYHMFGRSTALAVAATIHDGFVYSLNAATTNGLEIAVSTNRTGVAGAMYTPENGPAIMINIGGFSVLAGTTGYSVLQGTTAGITVTNLTHYLLYPFTLPSAWNSAANTYPINVGFGSALVYYSASITPQYRLYYFGGTQSLVSSAANGLNTVYWSDLPVTGPPVSWSNTWTAGTVMPTGRYGHKALTIQQ